MTNVVTGSSGFIGSRLTNRLLELGHNVVEPPHEKLVNGCKYQGDNLFFLSTYGNMAHHGNHEQMVRANVTHLLYVLNKFFGWTCYMSSSSVTLPVQTPYSRTKRAAEEILQALPELKSCIVRPYSVTGVGEQKEHLIPTLIRSCMEGEEMPFDPHPTHDFIDVEDVVDGLIQLADEQATGIYEFGWGFPVGNYHVKEMVEVATGREANVKLTTAKLRPYDNYDWYCKDFNRPIKPKKPLIKSISEMVEAYKREHA